MLSHCRQLAQPWGGSITPPSFLCRNQNTPYPFTSRCSILAIYTSIHSNVLSFFRMIYQKQLLQKGQGGWPTQTGEKLEVGGIFHLSYRQRRGWWESITTDDGLPPPEVLTYDEYTFDFLGLENEEERNGTVESGKSATTNLKSPCKFSKLQRVSW